MADGKKNKRQINGSQIFNEISVRIKDIPKKEVLIVIEQVSAMPGQGVTSMFNFGQSFGVIKGICSAMQLSMYLDVSKTRILLTSRKLLILLEIEISSIWNCS